MLLVSCGGGSPKGAAPPSPAAPAPTPLAVEPMHGPFATTAELCAAAVATAKQRFPDEPAECWEIGSRPEDEPFLMPGASLPTGSQPLAAPFKTARFVAVGLDAPACHLAVEMPDGRWYATTTLGTCGAADTRSNSHLAVLELAVSDVLPGGAPELRLRYRTAETLSNLDGDGVHSEKTTEHHLVCGVGASAAPSCIAPFGVAGTWSITWLEDARVDPEMSASRPPPGKGAWQRTVSYAADALTLTGDAEPGSGAEQQTGRHPIVFR